MNDQNQANNNPNNNETRSYRPALSFYHPNGNGTGCAVSFELQPAHDKNAGCIYANFAPQKTIGGNNGEGRIPATFDWKNKLCVKLDIPDLAQMLQVFHGACETLADGKGLYHASSSATTIIRLEHRIEPVCGYAFDLNRKMLEGETRRASIFLTSSEALAFSMAIEQSLGLLAFGVPSAGEVPRTKDRLGA